MLSEQKIVYECKFCDHRTTVGYERHCITRHNVYPCDFDDYKCSFYADSRQNLHSHKVSEHGVEPAICCKICNYTTTVPRHITKHIKYEHSDKGKVEKLKDGSFKCNYCDFKSKGQSAVSRHKAAEHFGVRYKCGECDYVAKQRGSIYMHKQAKHDDVVFSCHLCEFKSGYKHTLSIHLKAHDQNHVKTIAMLKCEQCPKTYQTQDGLRIHREVKHEGLVYRCETCNYKTQYRKQLRDHSQRYHEKGGLIFSCTQCPFKTASKTSLKTHMAGKHGNDIFSCNECDFTSTYESNLRGHKRRIHSKDDSLKIKCQDCPFTTIYNQSLMNHMKSGHRELLCRDCNFVTTHRQTLFKHKVEVHGVKSLISCKNCKFVCKTEQRMKKHIKKNVSCKICEYNTCSRADLVRHRRLIHNIGRKKTISLRCDSCGFISKTKGGIWTHKTRCDPNKKTRQKNSYVKQEDGSIIHIESKIISIIEFDEKITNLMNRVESRWECRECSFLTRKKSRIEEHVQKHITGFSLRCAHCEKTFSRKGSIKTHEQKCKQNQKSF